MPPENKDSMLGEQQNGTDKENKKGKRVEKTGNPPRKNNVSSCHFSHQPTGANLHKSLTRGRRLKRQIVSNTSSSISNRDDS